MAEESSQDLLFGTGTKTPPPTASLSLMNGKRNICNKVVIVAVYFVLLLTWKTLHWNKYEMSFKKQESFIPFAIYSCRVENQRIKNQESRIIQSKSTNKIMR